jgi:hypothetical protein
MVRRRGSSRRAVRGTVFHQVGQFADERGALGRLAAVGEKFLELVEGHLTFARWLRANSIRPISFPCDAMLLCVLGPGRSVKW